MQIGRWHDYALIRKGEVTTERVRAALTRNGYNSLGNFIATFSHITPDDGNEAHDFGFRNDEGKVEYTKVFIWMGPGDQLLGDW